MGQDEPVAHPEKTENPLDRLKKFKEEGLKSAMKGMEENLSRVSKEAEEKMQGLYKDLNNMVKHTSQLQTSQFGLDKKLEIIAEKLGEDENLEFVKQRFEKEDRLMKD